MYRTVSLHFKEHFFQNIFLKWQGAGLENRTYKKKQTKQKTKQDQNPKSFGHTDILHPPPQKKKFDPVPEGAAAETLAKLVTEVMPTVAAFTPARCYPLELSLFHVAAKTFTWDPPFQTSWPQFLETS